MNLPRVLAECAFGSDPGAAVPVFNTVTDRFVAAGTKRGRSRELDRFQAGKATVVLKSNDRALEPEYSGSPYYPNVVPQRRFRLRTPKYPITVGRHSPAAWWRFLDGYDKPVQQNEVPPGAVLQQGVHVARTVGPVMAGNAASLNAGPYFAAAGDTAKRLAFTGDFTFEAWIKRTDTSNFHIIAACQQNTATKNAWEVRMQNGTNKLQFVHANNTTVETFTSTGNVSTGAWHHIAVIRTVGGFIYFLIDGVVDSSFGWTILPTAGESPALEIGRRPGDASFPFKGEIAEPAVYGVALTQPQLATHVADAQLAYGIFDGHVDGWPPKWRSNTETLVDVDVTDGFEYLNIQLLRSVGYAAEVLADSPRAYWRLGDNPASELAADSSGNARHADQALAGVIFNTEGALIADIDGGATVAGDGWLDAGNAPVPSSAIGQNFTLEAWIKVPPGAPAPGGLTLFRIVSDDLVHLDVQVYGDGTTGGIRVETDDAGASWSFGGPPLSPERQVDDGLWHHVVVVYDGTATWRVYTDGVATAFTVGAGGGPANFHLPIGGKLLIGGTEHRFINDDDFLGGIDEVAIYGTALSAARVLAHYNQGAGAWGSQLTGTRVNQVLDTIGWPAGARSVLAGRTVMPPVISSLIDTSALEHLQAAAAAEAGYLFMSADGKVVFRDRYAYLFAPYRTSQATFGDGPGELPYTTGGIEPTYDKTEVWTHAEFTREGGTRQERLDDTARQRYGIRTLTESGLLLSTDGEAFDRAGYYVARFKDPLLRFRQIELDPTAYPALWPIVLALEIGDLVTVVRRPAGGGSALTKQVRIEGIEHDIDANERTWLVTLMLSPLDLSQWAVADDPVLSILDSGIMVGY